MSTPEDIFGVLRDLLQGLESRLRYVRRDVERREALASSTPSIWPAHGWLTGTFGGRSDPFSGEPAFHQGLDISTEKGQPVYATADGVVESASYTGDYGNLIVIKHGFGLATRYGHLSSYQSKARTGRKARRRHRPGRSDRTRDRLAPALRNSGERPPDQSASAPDAAPADRSLRTKAGSRKSEKKGCRPEGRNFCRRAIRPSIPAVLPFCLFPCYNHLIPKSLRPRCWIPFSQKSSALRTNAN